ncbi:hypothetical protein M8C21_025849 [Ambrosia artemisiifolia]|uniref:Jacalin-type lectin domain-containing protein n=1 Tax=Ambrosia artemisiifolia TaxID=4212 RepID=A0AAD5BTG5_AMBAR|nr:hypothetical protein M8C21_025849 [Ambrosia artemisiifolia]
MPQHSIEEIVLQHGNFIDSIKFQTKCSKGEPQSSFIGDIVIRTTSKSTTISIDCPKEYLMSISATFGSVGSYDALKSICFMTNLNVYGPYGSDSGTAFSYDVKDEVIVGFHGRASSDFVTAIGVFTKPKSPAPRPTSTHEAKIKNELCCSMSRMTLPRDVGPWGACGGKPWDDGVCSTIKQVRVHLGELNVIYGVEFGYMKSVGESVWSPIHGGTDGKVIHLVNLDRTDEFLIGISGFYVPVKGFDGLEAIVSISFHTNFRVHGPYGEERGAGYVSGKVVGFHGRNNGFLGAIGVHMEYF